MEETLSQHSLTTDRLATIFGVFMRCIELRNDNRLIEALAYLDGMLGHLPPFPPCLLERASILAKLGRYEESLSDCKKLLAHAPIPEHEKFRDSVREQAVRHYREQLAAPAQNTQTAQTIETRQRLANVHLLSGDYEQAIADYDALLQLAPNHHDALQNRAYAFVALNRANEALRDYERLLAINTDDAVGWYNYGTTLHSLNKINAAVEAYQRAIWLQPDFAEAQLELSHCLLTTGHFESGWQLMEWRWQTAQLKPRYLRTAAPAWLGQGSLKGKTLLLWAEQGFGDTLQFCRFAPALIGRAERVILRAPGALQALLRSLDQRLTVIDEKDELPPHDLHCPLMSLPLALDIGVPANNPAAHLSPHPTYRRRWADYLGERTRPRIGIVWHGRQLGLSNPTRDIPFDLLRPLLAASDAEFICLQKEPSPAEAARLAEFPKLRVPGPRLLDFGDTAALIEQLDLVISVDTAVAHLAGALGKTCWLLLRHSGEWRWQLERDDSPWYPSMRIFRQRQPGDWGQVIADVGRALAEATQQAHFA